jgi:uncharacterized protein
MDRHQLTALSEAYIRSLLKNRLPQGTPVYLYGSRARRDQRWNSDYDLWVAARLPPELINELEEVIDESFVPFKVDIVTNANMRGRFGDQVRKDAIRWI